MTLASRLQAQSETTQAALHVGEDGLSAMPIDFMGLSYEAPQLCNPAYFSAANTALIEEYRKLGTSGVLRLGGSLSDFTFWQGPGAPPLTEVQEAAVSHAKTYFEWILVDPIARQDRRAITTPETLHTLRSFLDATGWKLLYGLNFGTGNPELAALEAEAVQRILGPKLIAFQLGNESDFFGDGKRPKPWDFEHYWVDYQRFTAAIRRRVPDAQFGGPDVAVRTDWVVDYSKAAKGQTVMLSKHHYAMGPAENPAMNAEHLLGPDPDLDKQSATLMEASRASGIPCRMTEVNSCFHGGKPGVSDAYASALWAADIMLRIAQDGWSGINFHGGGMGIYSPIVGDTATAYASRPITYGMRLANLLAGGRFIDCSLKMSRGNMTAYVARKNDHHLLALINKGESPVAVSLDRTPLAKKRRRSTWSLTGGRLDSKNDVKLEEVAIHQPTDGQHGVEVAAYSGVVIAFS
jgi:hypothetical protein